MISFPSRGRLAAALLAVCLAPAAMSQTAVGSPGRSSRPDPLDAKAGVPALVVESSFQSYRRLSDAPVVSWREANDAVARIGGWRVYAREAQQPAAAAAPAASAATPPPVPAPPTAPAGPAAPQGAKPAPSGHGGHKMP